MVTKRTTGEYIFDSLNTIFIAILCLIFIYPLIYCLFASFSDPGRLYMHSGPLLTPLGFSLDAYQMVFGNSMILRGLLNTILYVVLGTALNLLMTSFAAYVLSRKKFFWKKYIMIYIVITMYFSGGLIPFYLQVNRLGLVDSPLAIIVPTAMSAFYMIMMRTYFLTIPDSMEESAVLDGANDFSILFKIILPLAMPVVSVMIVYYGISHWNSWFHAMIFLLKNRDWQPLQLILRDILTQSHSQQFMESGNDLDSQQIGRMIKYALIIITVLPITTIYPIMQRHFIKGVMMGSIKE